MPQKNKKPKKLKCEVCGVVLGGVKSGKKAKTRRVPSRIFAGHLCSKCTAEVVKASARLKQGKMKESELGYAQKKYVKMISK